VFVEGMGQVRGCCSERIVEHCCGFLEANAVSRAVDGGFEDVPLEVHAAEWREPTRRAVSKDPYTAPRYTTSLNPSARSLIDVTVASGAPLHGSSLLCGLSPRRAPVLTRRRGWRASRVTPTDQHAKGFVDGALVRKLRRHVRGEHDDVAHPSNLFIAIDGRVVSACRPPRGGFHAE
jgi:hypothetical protein